MDDSSKIPSYDPSILAALKRAASLRTQEAESGANDSADAGAQGERIVQQRDPDRSRALLKKLQLQTGQDDMDLDMGFGGGSRYDDEDEVDPKQKLSEWKGADVAGDDEDDEGGKQGVSGAKRKRGGKKKKGDKNSFTDVMSVLEGRKKA